MSSAEPLSYVSSEAKTKVEAKGSPVGLGRPVWIYHPGKRIPGYYTRLVDGIVYEGIKRLPTYEEHSPPFDLYLLALKVPPEPKRYPITEKRYPPFPRYEQTSGTVIIEAMLMAGQAGTGIGGIPSTGLSTTLASPVGVSAEAKLSEATAEPTVSATPGTYVEPVGVAVSFESKAEGSPEVSSEAGTMVESVGASAEPA